MPSSFPECFQRCQNCKSTVQKYEVTLTAENGKKLFVRVCKSTYRKLTEKE